MPRSNESALQPTPIEQVVKTYNERAAFLEEKSKTPDHKEIKSVYEGSTNKGRIEIDTTLMKTSFEKAGVHNLYELESGNEKGFKNYKNGFKLHNQTREQLPDGSYKPQIFYNRIEKKEKGKKIATDEVMVVIRVNNSEDPSKSSVLIAQVKEKNGVINLKSGIFRLYSEDEFEEKVVKDKGPIKSLEDRWARGEYTREEYKKRYPRLANGRKTLKQEIAERDSRLMNEGSAAGEERRRKGSSERAEILERLEGKYSKLLTQEKGKKDEAMAQALEKMRAEAEAAEKRKANTLKLLKGLVGSGQIKADQFKMIAQNFGFELSDAEVENAMRGIYTREQLAEAAAGYRDVADNRNKAYERASEKIKQTEAARKTAEEFRVKAEQARRRDAEKYRSDIEALRQEVESLRLELRSAKATKVVRGNGRGPKSVSPFLPGTVEGEK